MNKIPKNFGAVLNRLIYLWVGFHKAETEEVVEKHIWKKKVKSSKIC